MKKIKIALVGNPNSGKTTLFNLLTGARQHVGNWPGVTVERKEGRFHYKNHELEIIDLPGIYSLSPNSIEEVITRNYIISEKPDIVLNIIDGTTLERSLYLTTQLIDIHVKMIIAVNMYDEVLQKKIDINFDRISELLKIPVLPIIARKEIGIKKMLDRLLREITHQKNEERIHINYGEDIEKAVKELECQLLCFPDVSRAYYSRWMAIQLLSGDEEVIKLLKGQSNLKGLKSLIRNKQKQLESLYKNEVDSVIMERRLGFILGIIRECVKFPKQEISKIDITELIDSILLNKYLSFPIFALILWGTFQLTFTVGGFFSGWIHYFINLISGFILTAMSEGMLRDLIVNGILSGVGGILVFLPQIMILFLVIAILEDSGYMARVAFIMDRLMHFLGIHGKSFISLFMGIGCNVPGIMAARTLENEDDRKITVLINPFMSCSARLPVYVLITGMFFKEYAGTVIFSLYILGIIVAIFTAKILKAFFFKKKSVPFVMELPPYRTPSLKSLVVHMWERASLFLKKMGGVILVGAIIIWALGYFPRLKSFSPEVEKLKLQMNVETSAGEKEDIAQRISYLKATEQMEYSYIGRIGKFIGPIVKPLGFGWREGVALITGIVGKEIVVSTLSVLYGAEADKSISFKEKMKANGVTPYSAYGFLVFVLLYVPCLATISAIMRETNSIKWTAFSIAYGIGIGYLFSFIARQILMLLL